MTKVRLTDELALVRRAFDFAAGKDYENRLKNSLYKEGFR